MKVLKWSDNFDLFKSLYLEKIYSFKLTILEKYLDKSFK